MRIRTFIITTLLTIGLVGCSILHKNSGVVGKASIAEDKAAAKITQVDTSTAKVNVERLNKIGAISEGVAYSLTKDTNNSPAVFVADTLNKRVIALANKPDFKEAQEIANIVDQMITNQDNATKLMASKDKEIEALGQSIKDLELQKKRALDSFVALADKNAALADQYKSTLNQMDSFLGLGAVWYGLKRFVISSMWILGIGSILFLILRIASMSNPIAASLFSVFNMMGAWVINVIKVIVPKAVDMAGHVSQSLFNEYKSTLTKVVDAIQMAKTTAAASNRAVSLDDILTEASKSMNDSEKVIVDEIKKALNWK